MAHEIEFTIDENGNVEFDIQGFRGKGCAEIAEQFVKSLGKKLDQKQKIEFYKTEEKVKQKVKYNGF